MANALRTFAEMYVKETMDFFRNDRKASALHIYRMCAIDNISKAERDTCFEILDEMNLEVLA